MAPIKIGPVDRMLCGFKGNWPEETGFAGFIDLLHKYHQEPSGLPDRF
jgi:hypothetical protein